MNARVDHILDAVLALTAEERSAVAAELFDSLENLDHNVITDAWKAEIRRRREDFLSGITRPVPWTEARQRLSAL